VLRSTLAVLLASALFTIPVAAQSVIVGDLTFGGGNVNFVGGYTYIDVNQPAIADGTLNRATLRWTEDAGKVCPGAFRIRIFRPSDKGMLGAFTMVSDLGPFESRAGLLTVNLGSVAVQKGDLIGVATLLNGCGGIWLTNSPRRGDSVYELEGNFKGGVVDTNVSVSNARLAIIAYDTTRYLAGVVPVVGSVDGGFGSKFRTSVVVTNPSNERTGGVLVFHPTGQPASAGDPSLEFDLEARQSVSFPDVVASIGKTGLGSLDVLASGHLPVVSTSIFNDGGAAGTSGFSEELVPAAIMLREGFDGTIPIVTDAANFRMNVGVRTLKATTLQASVYDGNGKLVGTSTRRTYAAGVFEQVPLSTFLAGVASVPAGGQASISVISGGPAVLYATTTDNRTNDSRLQMITAR